MSITVETVRNKHVGDGASYVFPYTFRVDVSSSLLVYHLDSAGVETLLTVGTDYTIDGIGAAAGGNVTLLGGYVGMDNTNWFVFLRDSPRTQPTDYRSTGRVNLETIETSLDRLTQQTQELTDALDRSLRLQVTDTDGSGTFDAGGNRISNLAGPVTGPDLATKEYHDPVAYANTAAADSALSAAAVGAWCIVSDTGLPQVLKMCLLKADGTTKTWTTIASAPPF